MARIRSKWERCKNSCFLHGNSNIIKPTKAFSCVVSEYLGSSHPINTWEWAYRS
jgi:hypothetical protein